MQAVERQLKPVRYSQLVIHLAQVVLDYLLGGPQLVGNFLIAFALRDARDDRQFLG